jgi:hypothetical protein
MRFSTMKATKEASGAKNRCDLAFASGAVAGDIDILLRV